MLKNFEKVFADHWLAATNVDVENLQVPKLIEDVLYLFSVEFAWVATAAT